MDAKSMIIAEILKKEKKPFRPRHIWEPIGISPQALNNHLSRMIDKGILSKSGSLYTVINNELLIEEMVADKDKQRLDLPESTIIFRGAALNNLIELIDWTASLRALKDARSSAMSRALNNEIDDTIEELKRAKKYLNRKAYSENRAKRVRIPDLDLVWSEFKKHLEFFLTEEEFKA